MKSKLINYCYLLSVCCICVGAKVQASQPIRYLGIEQGLSNNAVTCITQDHYGFMWIGTYDGLNRYDGYQFKIFRNSWGEQNSLVNNHIKSIAAIGEKIFVGTEKGLMFFDYSDSRFHSLYYYGQKSKKIIKINAGINQIITDRNGNIYVAIESLGLLKFSKTDTIGTQITYSNKGLGITAITIDKLNRIWVFVNGSGLCRYEPKSNKIILVNNKLYLANCLLGNIDNNIWIGTTAGLYTFDPQKGSLTKFDESVTKLTSENIYSLTLSHRQEVWIATNGGGINIWNYKTHKLSYLTPAENANSLRSGAVTAVYEDNENRKWITTLRGGVNIIDDKSSPFRVFAHDVLNKNSVINNFILSFCEDEKHNIWIGTDGGGMSYWNTKNNIFTDYTYSSRAGGLSSNFVVSILNDYTNKLWVATFNGGIDAFDKATGTFKHYICYNAANAEEKNFWKLYEDRQHRLWASATWNGALYSLNRATDKFDLFDKHLTNLHTMYQDKNGVLWSGDYTRLIKIDINSKTYQYYNIGQPIRSIVEDNKDNFWIGTEGGGLILYNRTTNSYKRFTEANGLPSNSILNILVDKKNNLWCSTYNGLSEFNVDKGKFTNYYASDGLQSNQFNYNAAITLNNGEMLFGGLKGFTMFSPDSVKSYIHSPTLQLTDLTVNNKSIENNFEYSHHQPLYDLKKITIPFSEATIAINYTALEYTFPEKISYAYYLEGWDHNWNYVGKLKTAYYTRLNEGHYTLMIKATNTEGVWSPKPLMISLTVLPPWYRTWWAFLLYFCAISSVIYWFWRHRLQKTRLQYEIKIANLEIEREKEINERKLAFFTNVSHEFRTPLTLIINPIKDILNQSKDNKEELNIVYRNAKRLIGLVDHLLLFRKTESENAALSLSKVNFADLCKEVYTCFIHQAKIRQITYLFESTNSNINMYVDREKIEISLFNLISNAIKFTPAEGEIHIYIKEDDDSVYFEVADTGIGITADVGEKLFDKYYQVKDASSLKTGFGIGLYLVKTFIEIHNGTITYKNTMGGGTTFVLAIPKNLKGEDMAEAGQLNNGSTYIEDHISYDFDEVVPHEEAVVELELLISDHQSILIIDDNPEIRNYIKKIFGADYTVLEADNGKLGLEMIKKHLPDIVISDIVMPNLTGLELCHIMKEDSALSHIPIILLTGETTPDLKLQGIKEGAVDFVSKPFDKDLLAARIKGIIKNKTELQSYFYNEITLKNGNRNISSEHKEFLYKCIDVIENSLLIPDLDVSVIADKMGMSHSNLYKRIKQITGQSLNGFIRFIRLRKAAEVMINTNCNVNEAAFRVGFNDIKYFREHFHKQFGLNPSAFIKRHRVAFQKSYILNKGDTTL